MKNIIIRIQVRHALLTAILIMGIAFSYVSIAFATAPNPGHNFTEIGGGTVQGDILFGSAADTLSALAKNTIATRYLANTGTTNNPQWDQINLTNGVTGILPAANGGTGWANITANTVLLGSGAGAIATTSAGTNGFVLALSSGVPTWVATTTLATISGTLGLTGGGTNASLVASNGGMVWSNASQLQILAGTATANKVLMSGSSATPSWSTPTFPNANATSRKIIVSDGTNWVASTETWAVPGAVPNKLASDGTNWVAASGRILIGRQVKVNGNTTYVPTAGTNAVLIQMCAGGGGGGGATGATTPTASVGGGGGSGSYLEKFVTFSTTAASYVIAVGAGGTAGAAGNGAGGAGGSTTFACDANCSSGAVTFTANGGSGAPVANAAGTSVLASLGGAGGTVSTNGDVNSTGQPGQPAQRFSGSTGVSGNGAPSHFGGGGNSVNATAAVATAGNAGGAFCSGGGGAISAGSATGVTGGAGSVGVMVVWEFR